MTKPTHTYTDTDNLSSKLGTAQPRLVFLNCHSSITVIYIHWLFEWHWHRLDWYVGNKEAKSNQRDVFHPQTFPNINLWLDLYNFHQLQDIYHQLPDYAHCLTVPAVVPTKAEAVVPTLQLINYQGYHCWPHLHLLEYIFLPSQYLTQYLFKQ